MTETIFALSSGNPPAGVAVIRLSGPRSRDVLERMCSKVPSGRESVLARICHPDTGDLLDEALVLWFQAPASYTGEDIAELHLHGGRAVVRVVLDVLTGIDGLRLAEPGEFTRRAFEAGKLDLSSVEGIADLISADTEFQRKQAIKQASGALFDLCETWRRDLIRCRALIEAEFDFSDEEDIPESVSDSIWGELNRIRDEFDTQRIFGERSERLRDGLKIVILGRPNAGKSSLLNRLAQRDVAIVTEEAGTTRDVLSVELDLGGYPVTIMDTAGIRETSGLIEREGIRRALVEAEQADLVLELIDGSVPAETPGNHPENLRSPVWAVVNKLDLIEADQRRRSNTDGDGRPSFSISAGTGEGIGGLIEAIAEHCREFWKGTESTLISRVRHRVLLENASAALTRALESPDQPLELRAEEIRVASDEVGRIAGNVDIEDLLDVIFGEFCVGK